MYIHDTSNGVYRVQTVSIGSCNSGYERESGSDIRTCQRNGNWEGSILRCRRGNCLCLTKM